MIKIFRYLLLVLFFTTIFSCKSTSKNIESYFEEKDNIEEYNFIGIVKFGISKWDYFFQLNSKKIKGEIKSALGKSAILIHIDDYELKGLIESKNDSYILDFNDSNINGRIDIKNEIENWDINIGEKKLFGQNILDNKNIKYSLNFNDIKISGKRKNNISNESIFLDFGTKFINGSVKSELILKKYILTSGELSNDEIIAFVIIDIIKLLRDSENRR